MEDQRKRTLEALERRFAQAKEEFHAQQQKTKKRPMEDTNPATSDVKRPPADNVVIKPSLKTSSRKGNICFSGHTSKQDVELNEPAYFELSHSVNEKLVPSCNQISDKKATVDHILHDLFQHGDAAQKYIQGSKSMRIENTILLDNYVEKRGFSNHSHVQARQKCSKRSKKHMSLKQHKKKGTYDMPEEFHNFEIFKSMHEKWKSYTSRLLNNVGKDQLAQYFLNADLHGATILVVRCKIVADIGTYGIMIRETEQTFGIITQDNKFRVVPKKLSVFVLQADCWKITLLGDGLASRRLIPWS
ncbi:ribonuclease MRP protein subunit POP4-like [Primulina eburnea]|uniref:ribonuclease MRP protein subunit POP4-like n=1 Tax=Primulina eburnea TaxID=1245227 RepID=UPI003C6C9885